MSLRHRTKLSYISLLHHSSCNATMKKKQKYYSISSKMLTDLLGPSVMYGMKLGPNVKIFYVFTPCLSNIHRLRCLLAMFGTGVQLNVTFLLYLWALHGISLHKATFTCGNNASGKQPRPPRFLKKERKGPERRNYCSKIPKQRFHLSSINTRNLFSSVRDQNNATVLYR